MRNFRIDVEIVDRSRIGSYSVDINKSTGDYRIVIDQDQIRQMSLTPYAVAFHEMGHVLGEEFHMPRHMAFACNPDIAQRTMDREHEAWDVAEAMMQMTRCRRMAIKSYEHGMGLQRLYEDLTNPIWARKVKP